MTACIVSFVIDYVIIVFRLLFKRILLEEYIFPVLDQEKRCVASAVLLFNDCVF